MEKPFVYEPGEAPPGPADVYEVPETDEPEAENTAPAAEDEPDDPEPEEEG